MLTKYTNYSYTHCLACTEFPSLYGKFHRVISLSVTERDRRTVYRVTGKDATQEMEGI